MSILSATRQITGAGNREDVKQVMREALQHAGINVPSYLK